MQRDNISVDDGVPDTVGQLVWSPADPAVGLGLVTEAAPGQVRVHFLRLREARIYTTRAPELAVRRYAIGVGEWVGEATGPDAQSPTQQNDGNSSKSRIRRRLSLPGEKLLVYELEDGRRLPESHLRPSVRALGPQDQLAALQLAHPESVRARMQGLALSQLGRRPGDAGIFGVRAQWLPHQVDVATRAIGQDPVRLLLADEVGLGKTVEAALIYAGLRAEGRADRVLILTPAPLAIQWLQEIYRKAHELLVLGDAARLADAAADCPDGNPFEAHQRLVMSWESLAAEPTLSRAAAAAAWDLVIVDEAHHLQWQPGGAGRAYALVESLSRRSRHLLLLTATPMALDPTAYHALLRLLDTRRFDAPTAFADVAARDKNLRDAAYALQAAQRARAPLAPEHIDALQASLADDPDDVAALAVLCAHDPASPAWAEAAEGMMEALRGRHGLADVVVRNRRGPVGGLPERRPKVVRLTATPQQDVLLQVGESVMLDLCRGMDDPHKRRRLLGEMLRALWATPRALLDILRPISPPLVDALAAHVRAVVQAPVDAHDLPTGDARLRWLVDHIRACGPADKLLVFVESAIAVRALKDALTPFLSDNVALFHRELAPRDQDRQVAWFRRADGPKVMLSTEAGGEGRNFQFCHQVVLYDLPWGAATVEQRIGRLDRVGQKQPVEVLVPYFCGGYEEAVVKIMQTSIGVLDRTVGGIDHALEDVGQKIAALILQDAPAQAWQTLFSTTASQVAAARRRVEDNVDPIVDYASYAPARAEAILRSLPADLEARVEHFVLQYAEHSALHMHARGKYRYAVEGAPCAAGRSDDDAGFVGTFSRLDALDHEDVDFFSFGHPLVEQALAWARTSEQLAAAVALCRGCARDGAAFVYCYAVDMPEDSPEARTYLPEPYITVAVDEGGRPCPELAGLLHASHPPLERMDPGPLRSLGARWRALVQRTAQRAEALAQQEVDALAAQAQRALATVVSQHERHLRRATARQLAAHALAPPDAAGQGDTADHAAAMAAHEDEERAWRVRHDACRTALQDARAQMVAAVAVRLMRASHVSV